MPDDLQLQNGKDPTANIGDVLSRPVQSGIDGVVKKELQSPHELMRCPWKSALDQGEFQILLGRELESFGYRKTLDAFEKESGIPIRNLSVDRLRTAIVAGDWPTSIEALQKIFGDSNIQTNDQVILVLYKEIYLELLNEGRIQEAVTLLRDKISGLCSDHKDLQTFSSWFLCASEKELRKKSGWPGVFEGRLALLGKIQELAVPTVMTRDHHLAGIIEDRTQCHYPDTLLQVEPRSLLGKSVWGTTGFVLKQSVKVDHPPTHISFCSRSDLLAYGTEGGTVGFVNGYTRVAKNIDSLQKTVSKITFSPDGQLLLVSSLDHHASVYDCSTERPICTLGGFKWPVLACAWFHGGISTASEDGTVQLHSIDGHFIESLDLRANDLVANDSYLYVATNDTVAAYQRNGGLEQVWSMDAGQQTTSMSLSQDGHVLAADAAETTLIIDACSGKLINEIMARPSAPCHVVRSCLVANFLVRGYYDPRYDEIASCSTAYVWSWRTGQLITRINVSDGPIAAAAWNHEKRILALASDDHHIYFLEPEDKYT